MKLPKNYFSNLSPSKYREYLKLLPPGIQNYNTKAVTALILTFIAMAFFGIFAINPTLSTIITLKRQLVDSRLVHEKLQTKIRNLSSLQQQYNTLTPDLPIVFNAIPQSPNAPSLIGQIIAQSQKNNTQVVSFRASEMDLSDNQKTASASSFIFFVQAQGSYDNLINFSRSVAKLSRIMTIESMTINKDVKQNILILGLSGRGYHKK